MGQDAGCDIDSPYCNYAEGGQSKLCGTCRVRQQLSNYGGNCDCDPRTQYCSQASDQTSGQCVDYTTLNVNCINDDNCQTTVVRALPSGGSVTLTNEKLFCVAGRCKPCQPTEWQAAVGALDNSSITCAGYTAQVSSMLGRYATASRLSAVEYTCTADGDIVLVQPTVDYNYEYPCGDRALWPSQCVTASPSLAPSARASAGANSGAAAPRLAMVSLMFVAIGTALVLAATV